MVLLPLCIGLLIYGEMNYIIEQRDVADIQEDLFEYNSVEMPDAKYNGRSIWFNGKKLCLLWGNQKHWQNKERQFGLFSLKSCH
jgi:hypothetical protein